MLNSIDDKQNIFNEIGALNSIKNDLGIPTQTNSLSSINNSEDIIPFFLDILTVLIGSTALKQLTGDLLTSFIRNVEPTLKSSITNQTQTYNSSDNLPSVFQNDGYRMKVSDIDPNQKYKTNPNSSEGEQLYGSDPDSFDRKVYDAISAPSSQIQLTSNSSVEYDDTLQELIIKPSGNVTIGEFLTGYVNDLTLIDESIFIPTLIDSIFGGLSASQNKSLDQLINEEKNNTLISKLVEDKELEISEDELQEINQRAENKKKGINTYDLGCAVIDSSLDVDQIKTLSDDIINSSDSLAVGNEIGNTVDNSISNKNQLSANDETIKDSFFKRLINQILITLLSLLILNPQIKLLFILVYAFSNDNEINNSNNLSEDISKNKGLVDCIKKSAKSAIFEFIFELIKKEVLKLIIPISKKILREKINQYLGVLRALIPF